MSDVSIKGLSKAKVLQTLFNNSKQQGMGMLNAAGAVPMTLKDAQEIVSQRTDFDYLRGRVMKVNISGDAFNPWGYDQDNGQGAAERAIASIR